VRFRPPRLSHIMHYNSLRVKQRICCSFQLNPAH
jgi:hypothetical protein